MLWLHPDLVRLDRLRADPDYGRTDAIEMGSSPELGRVYGELIVSRLARLARAMPEWDAAARAAFVRAERALVSAQVRGWRADSPWAAWRGMFAGEHTGYGQFLADQRFDRIEEMAQWLNGQMAQ
jgi:hypothetical protein